MKGYFAKTLNAPSAKERQNTKNDKIKMKRWKQKYCKKSSMVITQLTKKTKRKLLLLQSQKNCYYLLIKTFFSYVFHLRHKKAVNYKHFQVTAKKVKVAKKTVNFVLFAKFWKHLQQIASTVVG